MKALFASTYRTRLKPAYATLPPPLKLTSMALCQDIFEQIIDSIPIWHDLGRDSLEACALVSSSFRHFFQKRLFYSVSISECQTTINLYNILCKNPQLSLYIRDFRIVCIADDSDSDSDDEANYDDPRASSVRALPGIIGRLLNLDSLQVIGDPMHIEDYYFTSASKRALFEIARTALVPRQ